MVSHLDLPYGKLGDIREKAPLNYAVLTLPKTSKKGAVSDEPTTSFEEAKRGDWGLHSTNGPVCHKWSSANPKLKNSSFAKWVVHTLPINCTLVDALDTISRENAHEERVLKYKIRFKDASELTFTRTNPETRDSLAYSNYYSPNMTFEKRTEKLKKQVREKHNTQLKFIVDVKGHQKAGGTKKSNHLRLPGVGVSNSITGFKELNYPTSAERKALFMKLDPNGNGMLSLAELDRGVVMLWPSFNNKPAIMRAYKAADRNGTGFIAKGEFEYFLRFLQYYNNMWMKFSKIDSSADRRVTLDELTNASSVLGISSVEAASAFRQMDRNSGGYVLFDEFAMWMAKNKTDSEMGHLLKVAQKNATSYTPHASINSNSSVCSRGSIKSISSSRRSLLPTKLQQLPFPTPQERLALFKRLDPNANGHLSLAELDKGILELWPQLNNKPAIMRAYKAADKSGNGWIGKREFKFFLKYIVAYNELWNSFANIDKSDDRRITKAELVC